MLFLQVPEDVLRSSEPLVANRAVFQTLAPMLGSKSFCE